MCLTFIYFCTNVLFVYAGQANFWEERRKAVKDRTTVLLSYSATVEKELDFRFRHSGMTNLNRSTVAQEHSSTLLLAKLPANLPATNPAQILQNLNNTAIPKLTSSLSMSVKESLPKEFEKKYAGILSSLPYSYGQIRNITLPTVKPNGQTIIHIQDVHMNPEAQENIGKTLQELIDKKAVNLVALEGAFGNIEINRFRSFPNREDVRTAADYMLRVNKISGAIHTALTSAQNTPPFVGIDDNQHYWANVEAYKQSVAKVKEYKKLLADLSEDLTSRKTQVLNKDLLAFDTKVEAYRKGKITLGDYAKFLTKSMNRLVPSPSFPNVLIGNQELSNFLKALEAESSLDFTQVDKERSLLIELLTEKLDKEEIAQLMNFSVTYRTGQIRYTYFYQFLQNLCRNNKIELAKFPAMQSYIKYVLISDKINAENLFKEINRAEEDLYVNLIKTKEEKELIDKSKLLILTGKLLDFSLTPEEWEEYKQAQRHRKPETENREPNSENQKSISDFGLRSSVIGSLESFENFYQEANIRDAAMADNFKKAMETHKASVGVIVTGGFHSGGLEKRLSETGTTVITFTPKITKVDTENGSAYLSVFAQEKTPLEKLFEGDKLFVSPIQFDAETNGSYLAVITAALKPSEATLRFKKIYPDSQVQLEGEQISANLIKVNLSKAGKKVKFIIKLSGNTIHSVIEKADKSSFNLANIGSVIAKISTTIYASLIKPLADTFLTYLKANRKTIVQAVVLITVTVIFSPLATYGFILARVYQLGLIFCTTSRRLKSIPSCSI